MKYNLSTLLNRCSTWRPVFSQIMSKEYFNDLSEFINDEYTTGVVFPKFEDIFKCFELTDYNKVSVVVLGQEPFLSETSNGLAFGNSTKKMNVSTCILTELHREYSSVDGTSLELIARSHDMTLEHWAKQNVLLMNVIFTTRVNPGKKINIHARKEYLRSKNKNAVNYWKVFSADVIRLIAAKEYTVFLSWSSISNSIAESALGLSEATGNKKTDKEKRELPTNILMKSTYPSISRGRDRFDGCNHFLLANVYLKQWHKDIIKWI